MMNMRSCLVLAPHTDDGEFGCGGTIARLVESNVNVHYVAFSICEDSVHEGFAEDVLHTECIEATQTLGIKRERLHFEKFKVRRFAERRQEILDRMITYRSSIQPDLVLLPSQLDIHQDHRVVCEEGIRAFKFASLLGYELPWNTIESSTSMYVSLSPDQMDRKIRAIREYRSQACRSYTGDAMSSLAKVRGLQAGCKNAEAFQVVRWIVK